jgi:hypothetical protein
MEPLVVWGIEDRGSKRTNGRVQVFERRFSIKNKIDLEARRQIQNKEY